MRGLAFALHRASLGASQPAHWLRLAAALPRVVNTLAAVGELTMLAGQHALAAPLALRTLSSLEVRQPLPGSSRHVCILCHVLAVQGSARGLCVLVDKFAAFEPSKSNVVTRPAACARLFVVWGALAGAHAEATTLRCILSGALADCPEGAPTAGPSTSPAISYPAPRTPLP